ncbi:serine/threonine protein kinase [Lysinibacillus piscis]|uniref:Serine/threonine protein kinase n=2 Tax=Lysinibacillus piscis TaxID=2518931 RepID=A0ABQ5NPQ2_9BACI|nr:serine/threonine protein kinase [Lysinibacillus sp. KH24]
MKSVNRMIVLNMIRKKSPISRAQIAQETQLTPPTVSSIVKELIESELVKETQLGESQGGRKPTLLTINHLRFYVIGVDAGPSHIKTMISDLQGNIINKRQSKSIISMNEEEFLGALKEEIREIIHEASIGIEFIGIGVAMHGAVDVETGIGLFAPNLGWRNIPIKDSLELEFGISVKVENDARAMAMGEYWFGEYDDTESLVTLNIGRGVGAGIIINGQLFYGAQSVAGEIGHMTIDLNGELCECGNRGCLQTLTTGDAIAKRAKEAMSAKMLNELKGDLSGAKVYELAKEGNEVAIQVLWETGKIIGIGIINLVHLLNPDKIIIGGGVSKASEFIMPGIKATIQERGLTQQVKDTEVIESKLGSYSTIKGAVAVVLFHLFHPIEIT